MHSDANYGWEVIKSDAFTKIYLFTVLDLQFADVTWNSLDAVGSRDTVGEFYATAYLLVCSGRSKRIIFRNTINHDSGFITFVKQKHLYSEKKNNFTTANFLIIKLTLILQCIFYLKYFFLIFNFIA